MKIIILPVLALAAALTVSCNKEQEMDAPAAKATHKATIEASIEETKTAYANDKTFSWLEGDKISVMEELNSEVKFDEFTATATGRTTSFDGEISEGATLGKWAVYPSNLDPQVTDGALSITLPRYYMLDVQGEDVANGYLSSDNPMANLPLVGQKQEDGKYKFSTAMGMVKFSFTNVPDDVAYVVLTANEVIAGTFTADENGVFSLNSTDGGNIAFFQVTPTEQHALDVYFPMPVGTLTAGLKVELTGSDAVTPYLSKTTVSDIEVVRNRVTEVAALEVPTPILNLEDIYGVYQVAATSYFAEEGDEPESTYVVIEPDDSGYGNVKFTTTFLGWPIDQLYGTFNVADGTLSVPIQYLWQDADDEVEDLEYLALCGLQVTDKYYLTADDMVLQFTEDLTFSLVAGESMPCIGSDIFEEKESGAGIYDAYTVLDGTWIMSLEDLYADEEEEDPSTSSIKANNYRIPFTLNSQQLKARKAVTLNRVK